MKIQILKNEVVQQNQNYVTCEEGDFEEFDFVKCKLKTESLDNTVMFLASQIKNINNESSN